MCLTEAVLRGRFFDAAHVDALMALQSYCFMLGHDKEVAFRA
jgi:hypothetical protein